MSNNEGKRVGGIQVGAVFPQTEVAPNPEVIQTWVRGVRDLEFEHVLAYDHVLSGNQSAHHPKLVGRYDENSPFHEVFVLFGYMAALAPELEMVTGVLILPQRQTALVAKQAATLDLLTGGKTRIGVGLGWNDIEYEGLNENFRNRARRLEEQIEVLRSLWTEPQVTVDAQWHTINAVGLAPMPVQRPIPIWIGANADVALRRAARLADGFLANATTLDQAEHQLSVIRAEMERVGRDPSRFGIEPRISIANTNPDDWKRSWSWWHANGMTHLSINTMGAGYTTIEEHLHGLATVQEALSRL